MSTDFQPPSHATRGPSGSPRPRAATRVERLRRQVDLEVRLDPELKPIADILPSVLKSKNLGYALPAIFQLKGEPVTLGKHKPLELSNDVRTPKKITKQFGRQIGKSQNNVWESIIDSLLRSHFNTLYVMPFFEQVRKLSTTYVEPAIFESPIKRLMVARNGTNQVLQRSFANGSNLFFSYAFRDPNRIRGANTNRNRYDEVQLMFAEILPIIQQTMAGSPFGFYQVYSGTPTTLSGTLEQLLQDSTRSLWLIPCRNCRFENVCSTEYHLEKMIGPYRDDISPEKPALICAKCRQPVFTDDGNWWHRNPERRWEHLGMQLPQPALSFHNQDRAKWSDLVSLVNNPNNSKNTIYNEIFAQATESGGGMINETQLRRASCLSFGCTYERAVRIAQHYHTVYLGIDWGGGTMKVPGSDPSAQPLSRTKMAIVGLSSTGKTDVLFGVDSPRPLDRKWEAVLALRLMNDFGCRGIAYDLGNGGYFSEVLLGQHHLTDQYVRRIGYSGSVSQGHMLYKPGDEETGAVEHYSLDKTKSLLTLCGAISHGQVRFFNLSDGSGKDIERGRSLQQDFLNLRLEQREKYMGTPVAVVTKEVGTSDDFVHAVNFAASSLWYDFDAWPDFTNSEFEVLTPQDLAELNDTLTGQISREEINQFLAG